jgi:peptide/nickel transport system permease protein/oligopeptide transport system permease protein
MIAFLLRRLGRLVLTLFLVSFVLFFTLRLMPGDPAIIMAGEDATPEVIANLRTSMGLDQPLPAQYAYYLENLLKGDLGTSIRSRQPVVEEIALRLPATLQIVALAVCVALFLGLLLGIIAAVSEGRWPDLTILFGALVGVSAPTFWIGLVLVLVFAVQLRLLPVAGYSGWTSNILPVASLVPLSLAVFSRLTRSTLLDVLGEDYIRTAMSKGVPRRTILWKHALRNALIPVITMAGLEFARLLGGVIAVEYIFAWPGVGKGLVDAINARDYPMVQGVVIAFAVILSFANLLVDLLNGVIDPRVRAY